jgi:hypothetical protein
MALFGVVYAVLENDIRRLLAYHIISQVGYMVAGVGLGTALALNGTSAHAFSHIFYKGLLMMSAGAVIYATGRGKLTELGQLAGPLRWTLGLMMIGAFSISGVPLFNGFVSKSMVVSAAAYADRAPIELMLLVASMGTFLHTGLKLPWFTFFGKDQGARVLRPVPVSMYVAMGLAAAVCFVTGVCPAHALRAAAVRRDVRPVHRAPLRRVAAAAARHGARVLAAAREARRRADDDAGHRRAVPRHVGVDERVAVQLPGEAADAEACQRHLQSVRHAVRRDRCDRGLAARERHDEHERRRGGECGPARVPGKAALHGCNGTGGGDAIQPENGCRGLVVTPSARRPGATDE